MARPGRPAYLPGVPTPPHTLASVLSRLQAGGRDDPELATALDRAFGKHAALIERFCRSELRGFPPEQVEEVVQDVFLAAWNALPTYRPDHPFRAFLWRIASNKCVSARRRKRDLLSPDGLFDPASSERGALDGLEDLERAELVAEAARNVLDPRDQEVVHLRFVLDYPLEDVAAHGGLASANEVRVALQRCKRRLERELRRLLVERGVGESFLR
jgi:RNA polymerase sigma-70 factor, ECF subfamily